MAPTKQEIEAKIKKMAGLIDNTVARASSLLDTAANDPQKLEQQVRLLGKQSATFLKRQKLELEIRFLKLQLQEIEKRIEKELEKEGKKDTRP